MSGPRQPVRAAGSSRHGPALEPVGSTVQRLAVLLSAGVAPSSAWTYLAESDAAPATVRDVSAAVAGGEAVTDALLASASSTHVDEAPAWRGLAAAWMVATEAGAPLAPTLQSLAVALRDLAQTRRDLAVALAAPTATARLVMALPIVGLLFGLALGFDTLGALVGTPLGIACLVAGLLLMLAARGWNRRLLAAAGRAPATPGLALDLLAIAVSGGSGVEKAVATVEQARLRCGLDGDERATADAVLALSRRAGVPAAGLLRAEAEETRRAARSEAERRAAVLAVTLMMPLGLCILPAFLLLGVMPLVLAVISSSLSLV